MFLISFGCDPEWLLDMPLDSFDAIYETAMRQTALQRADRIYEDRMVAHDGDGKAVTKHVRRLQKAAGVQQSGDDLAGALGGGG